MRPAPEFVGHHVVLVQFTPHRRVGGGAQREHDDAIVGDVAGKAGRELVETGLRCAKGAAERLTGDRTDAGHVDDPAASARPHDRNGSLVPHHRRDQIDLDRASPRHRVDIGDRAQPEHRRIRNEHVHRAQRGLRMVDHAPSQAHFGHIAEIASHGTPWARTSAAVSSSSARRRATTATDVPPFANSSANARPNPALAPVTMPTAGQLASARPGTYRSTARAVTQRVHGDDGRSAMEAGVAVNVGAAGDQAKRAAARSSVLPATGIAVIRSTPSALSWFREYATCAGGPAMPANAPPLYCWAK